MSGWRAGRHPYCCGGRNAPSAVAGHEVPDPAVGHGLADDADVRFGDALRRALDVAGVTAAEMAEQLSVTERSVRRYTSADRRPDESIVAEWERICGLQAGALMTLHTALPIKRTAPPAHGAGAAPVGAREPLGDRRGAGTGAAPVGHGRPQEARRRTGGAAASVGHAAPPEYRRDSGGSRAGILAWGAVAVLIAGAGGYVSAQLASRGGDAATRNSSAAAAREARGADTRSYARAMDRIFAALGEARVRGRRVLSAARTSDAQAAAARRLRTAYSLASSAIRRRGAPGEQEAARRRIICAVRAVRAAYVRLAMAARAGLRLAYRRASSRVGRAERRLLAALSEQFGLEPVTGP